MWNSLIALKHLFAVILMRKFLEIAFMLEQYCSSMILLAMAMCFTNLGKGLSSKLTYYAKQTEV
jgi:hypothetical protein